MMQTNAGIGDRLVLALGAGVAGIGLALLLPVRVTWDGPTTSTSQATPADRVEVVTALVPSPGPQVPAASSSPRDDQLVRADAESQAPPTDSTPVPAPAAAPTPSQVPPPPEPGVQSSPSATQPGPVPVPVPVPLRRGPDEPLVPPPPPEAIDPIDTGPVPAVPEVPPARVEAEANGRFTIRAEDQDIRSVLALLSRQSGRNLLVSPAVTGTIRIDLADVTFEQALEAIERLGALGSRVEGPLTYIYTAQELADLKDRESEPQVRVYHLNYIRASDLTLIIRGFLSETGSISSTPEAQQGIGGGRNTANAGGGGGGGDTGGGGMNTAGAATASAGGAVAGTGQTGGNSLASHDVMIIRDRPERLAVIDELVKRLDVQPPQVLIEAVILSVQLRDDQSLGVNYSLVDNLERLAGVSGNGNLVNLAGGFTPGRVLGPTAAFPALAPGQLVPGYLGNNQGLKFGFISGNVSVFIQAIQRFSKTNVLASPRVLVLNKQRAEIQLGQRLGYRNTFTNLTNSLQTVDFLSVGTLLTLRPYVSTDGMIRIELHPEKSSGFIDSQGVPQTNTSELTTNILVPDGATIVIGGLIDDQDEIVEEGVPGLSRIPLLGALFRNRTTTTRKTELIVLLTPRVIHRGGLPAPAPGYPPNSELHVPNTGPMPGPSFSLLHGDGPVPVPPDFAIQPPAGETLLLPRLSDNPFRNDKPSTAADAAPPPSAFDPGPFGPLPDINPTPGPTPAPLPAPSLPEMIAPPLTLATPTDTATVPTAMTSASEPAPTAPPDASPPPTVSSPTPTPTAGPSAFPEATATIEPPPPPLTDASPSPSPPSSVASLPPTLDMTPAQAFGAAPVPGANLDGPAPEPTPAPVGVTDAPTTAASPVPVPVPEPVPSPAPAAAPTAPAPAPTPATSASRAVRHVLQPGEDFVTLARYYYGKPELAPALAVANRERVPSADHLMPGIELVVPPSSRLPAPDAMAQARPKPRVSKLRAWLQKAQQNNDTSPTITQATASASAPVAVPVDRDLVQTSQVEPRVEPRHRIGPFPTVELSRRPANPDHRRPDSAPAPYRPGDLTRALVRKLDISLQPDLSMPARIQTADGQGPSGTPPLGSMFAPSAR
jgi:type IV pilus secretin PilQ/predicted competence protein